MLVVPYSLDRPDADRPLSQLPVPVVMKPWGLWLDGGPWGRRRFWTRSGAQRWADECNDVRRVLGLSPLVEVYNRFELSL